VGISRELDAEAIASGQSPQLIITLASVWPEIMLQLIVSVRAKLSAFGVAIALVSASSAAAQAQLPPDQTPIPQGQILALCQPPQPQEILLLVVTRTQETRTQVNQLLPPNTTIATCRYLNDTVTRVGGFRTVDRANAWARYITETTGLAAYVARPAEAPPAEAAATPPIAQTEPARPAAQPTQSTPTGKTYQPKPLGAGYAVLVSYFDQPEVAAKVQTAVGRPVGLAAYGQKPFLLVTHTTDLAIAGQLVQQLSERGFWASLVDSRRVMMLKTAIAN